MTQPEIQQSPYADFELLAEVSQLLTVIDLDGVLEQVIELVKKAVDASKVSIFLHDQEKDGWQRLLTMRDLGPAEAQFVVRSVLDQGVAGWVLKNSKATIVFDTRTDERWHTFPDDDVTVCSALCLPLMNNDQVLAVITLVHEQPNHFTEHHLRVMQIIANQISVAVRNAQLFNRLLEQQQQLHAILQSIPDVLLVINDDTEQIVLVNDEASTLLADGDQQDLIGKSLRSLIETDKALLPLATMLSGENSDKEFWQFETRSDRSRQDFVVTVSRWHNAFGNTGGHIIVMHDITTMRDLNRFKGEMLRMASHDLRSPLALIVGYTDLISLDIDPDSTMAEHLETIKRSTKRMNGLLDDLLRVEQIRSSPDELQQAVDLAELVNEVADNLQLHAAAKGQSVRIKNELAGLPAVTIDPVLIREAMENYTSNAVKYTPEGGQITLSAYADDNERVYFVVKDNGMGIPPDDIDHVFEWGYRSKNLSDSKIEGKGLGLSLVKSILERHKGEVWVESEVGVGSKFGFWLSR